MSEFTRKPNFDDPVEHLAPPLHSWTHTSDQVEPPIQSPIDQRKLSGFTGFSMNMTFGLLQTGDRLFELSVQITRQRGGKR